MKKYSIAILALLCFLGLTGCGTDAGISGSAGSAGSAGGDAKAGEDADLRNGSGNEGSADSAGGVDGAGGVDSAVGGPEGSGQENAGNGPEDAAGRQETTGTAGENGGTEEGNGTDLSGEQTVCRLRIVDGAESGSLVLAGEGAGQVYTLSLNGAKEIPVFLDEKSAQAKDLEDGMMAEIVFDGNVLESYPARLGEVYSLSVYSLGTEQNPGGSYYDLCGLYLQVLEDLWSRDPGLNSNISYVSVDLSQAPGGLTPGEREAIAWIFGCAHQVEPLSMTYEELVEQGYLTEALPGSENKLYQWEDGVLFSIYPKESDVIECYSLPVLEFNAKKWRSPTGAYFFGDCGVVWPEMGTWSGYEIGDEAIS